MNAKKLLRKLNYLPRWAWYILSLCVAGPLGLIAVYLVFHALKNAVDDQETEEAEARTHADDTRFERQVYRDADCVVSSDDEINRRWAETQASASRAKAQARPSTVRQQEDAQPISEQADVAEVIRSGHEAMRRIRHANDLIADVELSRQIDSIENSCGQILSLLEERENLLPQLRTFLRYYLPTTLRLLDARAKLENTASTAKAREVRARISEAVGEIDKAFLKQVDALDAYRFIDLESEMDVLRDMLKADGLVDHDEKKDDPFASVLSGH